MEVGRQTAQEVLDGVMLSDGGLASSYRFAYFDMKLSDKKVPVSDLMVWLQCIAEALKLLDTELCTGHPRLVWDDGKGRYICRLTSRISPFLGYQRDRWYLSGKKRVPEDIVITPLTLAHWFMGDGSSSRYKGCRTVQVELSTQCFSFRDIGVLEVLLRELGLSTGRATYPRIVRGSGVVVRVLQDSVDQFMKLVDPYILKPYRYKIKYREVAG